jgi:crossover junction endodeoxyribonuclease RusA
MTLTLPWPPSVNHYWRNIAGRTLISRQGRDYRAQVEKLAAGLAITHGRLAISIQACPPDKRRRDLDNLLKAPLDAMAHAGLYADDSQIDQLAVHRGAVVAGGRLVVTLRAMP